MSNRPSSSSVSVDLCPIDSLQVNNVYGILFYLPWKNCCCTIRWNFILISAMEQKWIRKAVVGPYPKVFIIGTYQNVSLVR